MRKDKYQLLSELKGRKTNRSLEEVCDVLEAFEFIKRKASKENSIWRKGAVTLTLPTPHGSSPVLKTHYVSLVVRQIELAEANSASEGGEEDDGD